MKPSSAVSFLAALALTACGNSTITLGGRTLEPVSSDLFQFGAVTRVVVSETPNFCGKLREAVAMRGCQNLESILNPPGSTSLHILLYGASDAAKLEVGYWDHPWGSGTVAYLQFAVLPAQQNLSFVANSREGAVQVEHFRSAQDITGSFEVNFDTAEKEAGHFAARYCDAFDTCRTNL